MSNFEQKVKSVRQLTHDDFKQHPVWTWYENDKDESLVMPIIISESLLEKDFGVLFILAELELRDGTILEGNISVNLTNRKVYALELYHGAKSFIFTGGKHVPFGTLPQLSKWLAKPIEAITPIKYTTPFSFENGEAIAGDIDLRNW